MFTADGKLLLLESFPIDFSLPKFHRHRSRNQEEKSEGEIEFMSGDEASDGDSIRENPFGGRAIVSNGLVSWKTQPSGKIARFFSWIYRGICNILAPKPIITVDEFFSSLKNTTEELKIVSDRAQSYSKAMKAAKASGQATLALRLMTQVTIHRAESQLYALGHRKVLTEKLLWDLTRKSPRGIRLTLMTDYVRIVPEDVLLKKRLVDDRDVADNWAILHYDPLKTAVATKAEIEAKKDPILVALIAGSRKLYVVGDWIDGDDDLTLDKITELLGSNAVNGNDIPAEVNL